MADDDAEEEAETPERLAAAVDVAMRAPNLAQIMDELELADYNDWLRNQEEE